MKELFVATRNRGKLRELESLLAGVVERLVSPLDCPDLPDVVEDGGSFQENAEKKARTAARFVGMPALADDSGLMVDALDGRPGVFSARFAGEGASDEENNLRLIREMAHLPPEARTAAFHCVLALCLPDGACRTFAGELRGVILDAPQGGAGFGYDPLFLVPEYGRTLAELPLETKNVLSHRGKALAQLREYLRRV